MSGTKNLFKRQFTYIKNIQDMENIYYNLYETDTGSKTTYGIEIISRGNIGTIDYVSGDININNIAVHALLNDTKFRIIANSLHTRIISKQGVLLNIPYDKTQIKLHA